MYIYVYIYRYVCVCVCVCVSECICTHTHTHSHSHSHSHTHSLKHTHTHTHSHPHSQSPTLSHTHTSIVANNTVIPDRRVAWCVSCPMHASGIDSTQKLWRACFAAARCACARRRAVNALSEQNRINSHVRHAPCTHGDTRTGKTHARLRGHVCPAARPTAATSRAAAVSCT